MTPEERQKTFDEIHEAGRVYRSSVHESIYAESDPPPFWRRIERGGWLLGNLFYWTLCGPFILFLWCVGYTSELLTPDKEKP